jgi:hypothetical protein
MFRQLVDLAQDRVFLRTCPLWSARGLGTGQSAQLFPVPLTPSTHLANLSIMGYEVSAFTTMQILKSGAVYFALVFGTGFILGTIRTLWIVPRLGVRTAELMEAPFMFIAIVLTASWMGRRLGNANGSSFRLAVGFTALALLLAAEVIMGIALLGLSPAEVFTKHDPVSGSVYYALLGVFAGMPWLFWKFGKQDAA